MTQEGVVEIISGMNYVRSIFYREDKKKVDSLFRMSHNNIGAAKDNIIEYKLFEDGDLLLAEPIRITGNRFHNGC